MRRRATLPHHTIGSLQSHRRSQLQRASGAVLATTFRADDAKLTRSLFFFLHPCLGQSTCRLLRTYTKSWTVSLTCPSRAAFTDRPKSGIVYRLLQSPTSWGTNAKTPTRFRPSSIVREYEELVALIGGTATPVHAGPIITMLTGICYLLYI